MSTVLSFAEESCWDGDRFRSVRRPVIFVATATFPRHGTIRHEFELDYGLFYDVEDDWLIQKLQSDIPQLPWDWLVYHKKVDHSGVHLINPDTGRTIGQIYPRGAKRQRYDTLPEGVASLDAQRRKRELEGSRNSSSEG